MAIFDYPMKPKKDKARAIWDAFPGATKQAVTYGENGPTVAGAAPGVATDRPSAVDANQLLREVQRRRIQADMEKRLAVSGQYQAQQSGDREGYIRGRAAAQTAGLGLEDAQRNLANVRSLTQRSVLDQTPDEYAASQKSLENTYAASGLPVAERFVGPIRPEEQFFRGRAYDPQAMAAGRAQRDQQRAAINAPGSDIDMIRQDIMRRQLNEQANMDAGQEVADIRRQGLMATERGSLADTEASTAEALKRKKLADLGAAPEIIRAETAAAKDAALAKAGVSQEEVNVMTDLLSKSENPESRAKALEMIERRFPDPNQVPPDIKRQILESIPEQGTFLGELDATNPTAWGVMLRDWWTNRKVRQAKLRSQYDRVEEARAKYGAP